MGTRGFYISTITNIRLLKEVGFCQYLSTHFVNSADGSKLAEAAYFIFPILEF